MIIKHITPQEAQKIIETRQPLGLFCAIDKNKKGDTIYIGINNTDGDAWTEDFYTIAGCMAWLRGEMEDD